MNEFKNLTEFRKEYDRLRNDILKRYGVEEGKKARLKHAIMLCMSISGGDFLRVSSVKSDMEDFIRIRENNEIYVFKLEAMV